MDRFPADHYVVVDDKLSILTAIKKIWVPCNDRLRAARMLCIGPKLPTRPPT